MRVFFSDSGAGAGLAKLNQSIKDVEKAAPGGARGVRAIETGLSSLAAEAVGVQGPIGRVAEGLLRFGGGSGLVLGAVAGIGLIATAYRESAKAANETADAYEKSSIRMAAAIDKATQHASIATIRGALAAAQTDLDNLMRAPTQRTRTTFGEGNIGEGVQVPDLVGAERHAFDIEAIKQRISRLTSDLNATQQHALAEDREHRKQLRLDYMGATKRADLDLAVPFGKQAGVEIGKAFLETVQHGMPDFLGPSKFGPAVNASMREAFMGESKRANFDFLSPLAIKRNVEGDKGFVEASLAHRDTNQAGAQIAAQSLALVGALKQGGAGGIITGVGGELSALSQIKGLGGLGPVGIVTTAFGGLFSLFDSSAERRHREKEERDQRRHEELIGVIAHGPERASNTFLGSSPEESLYESRRLDRLGGEPRIGG